MKELSIQEKAKRYDGNYKAYTELINRLENVKDAIKKQNYGMAMDILCKPYPQFQVITHSELKESEDERIRKAIKKALQVKCCDDEWGHRIISDEPVTLEEALAWLEKQGGTFTKKDVDDAYLKGVCDAKHELEKQGKNNMGISEATKKQLEDNLNEVLEKETPESWNEFLEKQGEQRPVIVPKFMVGDFIKLKDSDETYEVSKIEIFDTDEIYYHLTNGGCIGENADNFELVKQKPAEEYNITGIGSKNAQGKLGEMIKNLKPVNEVLEQKPADNEPKFEIGDWVVTSYGKVSQVVSIDKDGDGYTLDDGVYFSGSWCDMYHLWTIQDAENGDVLADRNRAILLFRGVGNNEWADTIDYYALLETNLNNRFSIQEGDAYWGKVDNCSLCPATKEQRDTLIKVMSNAGWEFDFDKKELKKIEPKSDDKSEIKPKFKTGDRVIGVISGMQYFITKICDDHYNTESGCIIMFCSQDNFELYEQKPAWSEEDERMKNQLVDFMLSGIDISKAPYGCVAWLKSLKERYTWKPSEEQMKALAEALSLAKNCGEEYAFDLRTLYEQLKKLKG